MSIFRFNKKIKDEYKIFIWCIFIFLCALTLRSFYISHKPPFWDNLEYQIEALQILRDWLNGEWRKLISRVMDSKTPAHVLTLGFGFLVIGMNPISPYIVSGFFGFGCLVAFYLLSVELGASRRLAFWGALAFSITPNFIYQNFLQTRNDYQLAFFITLAWIFFLRGIKSRHHITMLCGGMLIGLGALFKPSAPAYIVFGVIAFMTCPDRYILLPVWERIKLAFYFFAGALLISGGFYLPNILKIYGYYHAWGQALNWKVAQYGLKNSFSDYLYYPNNIVQNHLGLTTSLAIILLVTTLLTRKHFYRARLPDFFSGKQEIAFLILTLLAGILPLIFISVANSFASVGDIPVLFLLLACTIFIVSKLSFGITVKPRIPISLLCIGCIISFPFIPIVERHFNAYDLNIFSKEISDVRRNYGLTSEKIIQIYGHPFYNTQAYKWRLLIDPDFKGEVPDSPDVTNLIFPENPKVVVNKLKQYQLLITSKISGEVIGGENFHTFNRFHDEINAAIDSDDGFIKIHQIEIENNNFPISFLLNKNYKKLNSLSITSDNWIEWGAEFNYFSYMPSKIIWHGKPLRAIKNFVLQDVSNSHSIIKFQLTQISSDGTTEYESDYIPGSSKMRHYKLVPAENYKPESASLMDPRKLAFLDVNFDVK